MSTGATGPHLGTAYADIEIRLKDAEAKLNTMFDQAEKTVSSRLKGIGDSLQGIGGQMTLAFAPITGFVYKGVKAFADFDSILTEIEARTGATAEEMEAVKNKALEMGQKTAFSASDAADAMLELLSSGYDLNQTFTALQPVLDAAAASGMGLGEAADTVTDILAQFQLEADQAAYVADTLAAAAGASSATMTDLAQGFGNAGNIANQFGLSVEETAAILAVFAENGIKGAEAGTLLKSMLTNTTRSVEDAQKMWDKLGTSMFDAQGNIRPLNDVIVDLDKRMANMTDQERIDAIQTLAGAYGQSGLSALLASDGYKAMLESMEAQASANAIAQKKMESFKGTLDAFGSTMETIMINVIGPAVDAYITPMIVSVTKLLNKFNEFAVANPEVAKALGAVLIVLAVLGPAVIALGTAINFLAGSFAGISLLASGVGVILTSGLLLPLLAVAAAAGALYWAWNNNFMGIQDRIREFASQYAPQLEQIGAGIADGIRKGIDQAWILKDWLIMKFQEVLAGVKAYLGIASPSTLFAEEVGKWIPEGIAAGIAAAFGKVQDSLHGGLGSVASLLMSIIGPAKLLLPVLGALGWPILAIVAAIGALYLAYKKNFLGFADGIKKAAKPLENIINTIADAIKNVVDAFSGGGLEGGMASLEENARRVFDTLKGEFQGFIDNLPALLDQLADLGTRIWEAIRTHLPDLVRNLGEIWGQVIKAVVDAAPGVMEALLKLLAQVGEWLITTGIPELAGLALDLAVGFIEGFIEGFTGKEFSIEKGLQSFLDALKMLPELANGILKNWLAWIGDNAKAIYEKMAEWANAVVFWIPDKAIPWLREKLGDLWNSVSGWISENAGKIADKVSEWAKSFSSWVTDKAWPWLKENLGKLWAGFIGWITEKIPLIVGQLLMWGQRFGDWVVEKAIPWLTQKLGELWNSLLTWLQEKVPLIVAQLLIWGQKFGDWVTEKAIPWLTQKFGELWNTIINWLREKIPLIGGQLVQWGQKFGDWVTEKAIPWLTQKLGELWGTITRWIGEKANEIFNAASDIGRQLIEGIKSGITSGINSLKSAVESVKSIVTGGSSPVTDIGSFIQQGINQGMTQTARATTPGVVQRNIGGIVYQFRREGGMRSPSTLFADEVGAPIAQGIGMGIMENAKAAINMAGDMMDKLVNAPALATGFNALAGAQMQPIPAAAGSAGQNGNSVTINGGLNISVPLDVLRNEPQLQQNAENFGQSVMEFLRSQGGGMVGANG